MPLYSMRTKRSTPLLSSSSVPPYSPPWTMPSMTGVWALVGARPSRIRPPQSPGRRSAGGRALVNTMGAFRRPSAISRAPGWTIRVPLLGPSPITTVPGAIVSATPGRTSTGPISR